MLKRISNSIAGIIQRRKVDFATGDGNYFLNQGQYDKAREYHEKALKMALEIGYKAGQKMSYGNLGNLFNDLGDYNQAKDYYEKALKIALELRDKRGEGRSYSNLGNVFYDLGYYNQAKEYQEKALKIALEIRDKDGEKSCYTALVLVYKLVGDYYKAKEYQEKALKIALETNDKAGVGISYTNLALVYKQIGEYYKAKEYHEMALKIALESSDKAGVGISYTNLGNISYILADFHKAKEYHEKALKIALDIGDKAVEKSCYTNLALVYKQIGEYYKAKEYHEKALKVALETNDKAGVGISYTNLGNISFILADFHKAKEYHEKALKIALDIGDKDGEKSCYTNLGNIFYILDDNHKAKEYHEKALKIALDIGDKAGEEHCYGNLGLVFHSLGDYSKAKEYHEMALKIALDIGEKAGVGSSYSNLGRAFHSLGDYSKAKEYHEMALKIALEIGKKVGVGSSYSNLGRVFYKLANYPNAKEYYEKALKIAVEIRDIDLQRTILLDQGALHISTYEFSLAYGYLKECIELGESIGGKLIEENHKISFYALSSDAYQLIVPVCFQLDKKEEAFEFTERSKSKAFIDLLTTSSITPTLTPLSNGKNEELRALLEQEKQIVRKLQSMQRNNIKDLSNALNVNSSRMGDLTLDPLLKEIDAIYSKMEHLVPEYVFLRRAKPLALDKLQNLLSKEDGVALVEYFLTQDRIFIFVLRDKDLNVHKVELSEKWIDGYLNNYEEEVLNYPNLVKSAKPVTNKWLELSKYLIDPISEHLTNSKLVYFVPHGILHYLPLHALLLNNEPLVRTHPVAYSSSSSLLPFYKNKGTYSLKSCAVFGVEFFDEAQEVAKIYNVKPRLNVTTNEILKNLGNDILHFSCHGYFDYKDPLASGIVLKDDVLRAERIFDLNLNSELVTLSACETGLSENKRGDELIGLARAFIYAGVPSLVVSLWDVSAYTTKELMREFYTNLKKGDQKAVALQKAQVRIMEKYEHPFFWAPFILIGDWK